MAHHATARSGYAALVRRLNRAPQGAPPSKTLFEILKILFSEREAGLVAGLPIKPFSAETAARAWKVPAAEARKVLDGLADRALLIDVAGRRRQYYVLPPPMAGFFEFAMMRYRGDIDQKRLAQLYHQYLNVEEDFVRDLFSGETKLGRTFVQEPALDPEESLHVLDYERASEVVKTARHRAVGLCYCRHKMGHVGKACDAPLDICMTFGNTAASLAKHGFARSVDAAEGLDLLGAAYEKGLVQFGENNRRGVAFICNCCGCCCEALIAARRFAFLKPVHTTNFLPRIGDACTGCGLCVSACPVLAMGLVSANDPARPLRKIARIAEELCLGCGVCIRACKKSNLKLVRRPGRVITPANSAHRAVAMAIERGKLADLLFDNKALFSHRAMSAVLGAIMKLPPVQRVVAGRQVKSRFLEALAARMKGR